MNRDMFDSLLLAALAHVVGCSRSPATEAPLVHGATSQDAAAHTNGAARDVEVLWRMRIPSPFGATAVTIARDGTVGVIAAGKINEKDANRFLGHADRGKVGGTGIALFVVRDAKGQLWERRAGTDGAPSGLAIMGPYLINGNGDKSLYEQTGVSRKSRLGPPETVVGIAKTSDADVIFVDPASSKSTVGSVLGVIGDRVFTISGHDRLGRITGWETQRPLWHLDADAHIRWGEVIGDEIAVCVQFKGKTLMLEGRASIDVDGLEADRGAVVLWVSADGKVVAHQTIRSRIEDAPCGYFSAVRAGAIVTERRDGGKQVSFKLVPRDGTEARELLTVAHDFPEGLHIETDGQDQVVVVDQNFVSGAANPYPITLTVIDTARKAIRWRGSLPDGVGDYSSIALRGDLLVYAGLRVGPMEIDGEHLPKPERDASDAGIVVALKLPPLR